MIFTIIWSFSNLYNRDRQCSTNNCHKDGFYQLSISIGVFYRLVIKVNIDRLLSDNWKHICCLLPEYLPLCVVQVQWGSPGREENPIRLVSQVVMNLRHYLFSPLSRMIVLFVDMDWHGFWCGLYVKCCAFNLLSTMWM